MENLINLIFFNKDTPSLSVQFPEGSSCTQDLQLPRAPLLEELPPPPNIQVAK